MAEVLDETEEERLAREAEEERLAAEQSAPPQLPEDVYQGSPPEDIEWKNAHPPITITEPASADSLQYQQELARAQRGSGYIAADVGPTGNVITGAYDPAQAEAHQRLIEAKLAAQAERFAGVQGYQQSLKSGATPAEALALWGSKMFKGDPGGLVSLVTRREPLPKVVPVQRFQGGRLTPLARSQAGDFEAEIRSLRQELRSGTKPEVSEDGKTVRVPFTEAERAQRESRINSLQQQRKDLLDTPAFNPNVDRAGWEQMRPAWEAAGARPMIQAQAQNPVTTTITPEGGLRIGREKAADEQVIVVKDGRRYLLPKGQLEEAIKAGYEAAP